MMNKYIKSSIDIKKDAKDFVILKSSSFFKNDYKNEIAEKELIDSYIKSIKIIRDEILLNRHNNLYKIELESLCIPFMYLCRHVIELIIKLKIKTINNEQVTGHDNYKIWKKCKLLLNDKCLEEYNELIELTRIIDENGEKLRYVKNKEGKYFDNSPVFINVNLVYLDLLSFKSLLF